MRLETETETAVVSEEVPTYTFGIRSLDMGLVIDVLRSKMYTNPIRIICQEIAANARDANREAGHKNVPIRIHIDRNFFNNEGCNLIIEDDGPGISPERMTEIFINYGASTKRHTNTQTGGFGLGCKTPFAYTDTFTIMTKFDGVKYIYQAVIEKNRTGRIYLLSQEATTDSNGTAIIIPIKEYDKATFVLECHRSTLFWNPRPVFDNSFAINLPTLKVKEDCIIIDTGLCNMYQAGVYALVDDIPYFFNNDEEFYRTAVFLKFKTGELSISANRETLHLEKDTVEKITKRYDKFRSEYVKEFLEEIDKAPTYYHAALILSFCSDNPIVISYNKKNPIKWNGIRVLVDFQDLFSGLKMRQGRNGVIIRHIPHDFLNTPRYFEDGKSFSKARYEACLNLHNNEKNQPYFISKTSWGNEEERKNSISILLNVFNVELLSSVPFKRTPREARIKQSSVVYLCSHRYHHRNTLRPLRIDPTTKGYYVPYKFRKDITQEQINWAQNISYVSKEYVYFVKSHLVALYPNLYPLKTAEKKCEEALRNQVRTSIFDSLGLNLKMLNELEFPKKVKKLLCPAIGGYNTTYNPYKVTEQEKEEIKSILRDYPLISYYSGTDKKAFNEYIQIKSEESKE